MSNNNGRDFLIGALIGSAVGATVALLFAPKPGRELRQDINQGTKQAFDKAGEWKDIAQEKSVEYTEKAKLKGSELRDKGTEISKKAVDSTKQFSKEEIGRASCRERV